MFSLTTWKDVIGMNVYEPVPAPEKSYNDATDEKEFQISRLVDSMERPTFVLDGNRLSSTNSYKGGIAAVLRLERDRKLRERDIIRPSSPTISHSPLCQGNLHPYYPW